MKKFNLCIVFFIFHFSTIGQGRVGGEINLFRLRNLKDVFISFDSYPSAKGAVLVFYSNYCPFSKAYEDRLNDLAKKYKNSFPVWAINPNNPKDFEEDHPDELLKLVHQKKIEFDILLDETQFVSQSLQIERTPEALLVVQEGNKFVIKYRGAIDDYPQSPVKVKKHYLEDAIQSILADKPIIISQTKAVGCAIRYRSPN